MRTTTGKDKVGAAAASLSGAAATAAALGSWLPAIEKTYGAAVTGSAPVATVNAAGNTTGTTRSAAVGFEVRLKEVVEKFTKSPAPERSFVAFQVFDDIISVLANTPASAVYVPALQSIREELYNSVYSRDLTSTSADSPGIVDRVPYFFHVQRMTDKRQVELKDLMESLADKEQKIKLRERDLNVLIKKNLSLKQTIVNMETTVKEASENVVKMRASVYEAERFKNELVNQKAKEMEHMAEKMDSLRGELDVANDNLMKLSNFKAIEGNRAQAEDQHVDLELTKKHVAFDPLMVTKQQLAEAERLQEQMRDILIVHLDDYEHSMIQLWKKRDILKDSSNNNRQTSLKFNAEVAGVVESFKKRIQTFRDEQALLDHDIRKLKETATSYSRQKAAGTIHRWSNQSNRCYSVVLSYSTNNGKSFHLYDELPKCAHCGDATLLCPHQLFNSLDFSLKNSNKTFGGHPWTDIRLEKPGLKLALTSGKVRLFGTQSSHQATIPDLDDEEANADADQDSDFGEHLNTQLGISMRIIWRHYYRQLQGCRPTVHRILPIDKLMYFIQEINDLRFRLEGIVLENDRIPLGENHEGEHDFNRALLHNFVIVENEHGDLVLQTPKHLVEEAEAAEKAAAAKRVADGSGTAATSIIKAPQVETCMLAAYVDVVDLQFMRDHKGFEFSSKFSDFVYKFFEYRYQFKDIAVNVAHDFLSCLQVYEGEDKAVRMFVKHMSGEDEVGWKTLYLAQDLHSKYEKFTLDNYRKSLRIMYPYRDQEDYDQIELEGIAFTKNRLTKENVIDHLRYTLLFGTDPNYVAFLHNLKKYNIQRKKSLTYQEFIEAMSNIFPPAPTLLKRVRFELASAHFPDGRVPLDRVAMIGCYLMQWCSRNIGGWEHTPPLDIAGDTYIGFSAQEKIKLLNDSKTSDKTCRFTSLENVYGLADDEEDDDDDDADNEGVPVGSPRGKRKELHATLEATADNDANDTSSGNVSEAESAKAPLVTEATRRQQQAMERAKLRHAQDLKSAAQTVDAGAKILSVRRDIMADTEALATTMHNAEMEIGDAPNVTIVADDAADETAE